MFTNQQGFLMENVYTLPKILDALKQVDLVDIIGQGFVSLSKNQVITPPIGEMLFPDSNGEVHIKYGAIKNDNDFVIKMATGFFNNPQKGLPPFSGCMLVFSQHTGQIKAVLLEEGELTNHRTAAAGAVAAKYLAPKHVHQIGIVGTGVQARMQALYLQEVTECRNISVWGRDTIKAEHAAQDMKDMGFQAKAETNLKYLCENSQLIVTATPSCEPLLEAHMIKPGTHITAMGSDTHEKCELSVDILEVADIVSTDSIDQAISRGEISHALRSRKIKKENIVELGQIILDPKTGRKSDSEITVSDLSGVAIQDIMIAKAITKILEPK
ncbi:MAG: ornithine cyclodeaminase family protein [Rhodobacteraceae bacterium]|nr:ornithine cyclodeaminase family protein [Paracoccaceae bacterium]